MARRHRRIEEFVKFVHKSDFPAVDSWVRSAEGGLPPNLDEYVAVCTVPLDAGADRTKVTARSAPNGTSLDSRHGGGSRKRNSDGAT